jgi:hypothetical protein
MKHEDFVLSAVDSSVPRSGRLLCSATPSDVPVDDASWTVEARIEQVCLDPALCREGIEDTGPQSDHGISSILKHLQEYQVATCLLIDALVCTPPGDPLVVVKDLLDFHRSIQTAMRFSKVSAPVIERWNLSGQHLEALHRVFISAEV